jgi:hypothetical protein
MPFEGLKLGPPSPVSVSSGGLDWAIQQPMPQAAWSGSPGTRGGWSVNLLLISEAHPAGACA